MCGIRRNKAAERAEPDLPQKCAKERIGESGTSTTEHAMRMACELSKRLIATVGQALNLTEEIFA
jgi:hypothetical protein